MTRSRMPNHWSVQFNYKFSIKKKKTKAVILNAVNCRRSTIKLKKKKTINTRTHRGVYLHVYVSVGKYTCKSN